MTFVRLGVHLFVVAVALPSPQDLERASRSVPRDHVRGGTPSETRQKINAALTNGPLRMQLPTSCDEFSLATLGELQQTLFSVRSAELFTQDLRAPRHASAEALAKELEEERATVQKHPGVEQALRDGRCAEIALYWAHHLSDETRAKFADTRLPLLASRGSAEHAPQLIHDGHVDVVKRITSQITCVTGHDATAQLPGNWTGFPSWPFEVTYTGMGYGQYPFWTGGTTSADYASSGTPIRTTWSSIVNAEKLEHGNCNLTFLSGANFSSDGPCTHLMLGTQYGYLYNKEETHCCISSSPDYACHFSPVDREFYKFFDYQGEIEHYISESGYYSGPVKHYSLKMTNDYFYFWYVTDPTGRPIEQGEGPVDMYCHGQSRYCGGDGPVTMFHQYDLSTFSATTLNHDVFKVPEVCQTTNFTCLASPTSLCSSGTTLTQQRRVKRYMALEIDARSEMKLASTDASAGDEPHFNRFFR
jgi:hypothetical protein